METEKDLYYKTHVFCCINERKPGKTCCAGSGSVKLRGYMKARIKELGLKEDVRINNAGCLDRCDLGPVMVIYPEGIWYHYQSTEDIDEIIQKHLVGGEIVERLKLEKDDV